MPWCHPSSTKCPISRRRPFRIHLGSSGEPCSARGPCTQKLLYEDTQKSSLWLPAPLSLWAAPLPTSFSGPPSEAWAPLSAPSFLVAFPQRLLGQRDPLGQSGGVPALPALISCLSPQGGWEVTSCGSRDRDLEGWASLKAPGAPLRLRRSPLQGLTVPSLLPQAAPCSGPWVQPLCWLSERWEPGNAALCSRRLPEPHFLPCPPGRGRGGGLGAGKSAAGNSARTRGPEVRTQSCRHPCCSPQELGLYSDPAPWPEEALEGGKGLWGHPDCLPSADPHSCPSAAGLPGEGCSGSRKSLGIAVSELDARTPTPCRSRGLLWVGGQQEALPVPVGPGPPDVSGKVEIKLGTCSRSLVLCCAVLTTSYPVP